MPVFRRGTECVLFIHIPKAAGTSIENLFVSQGYRMEFRRGGVHGPLNAFDRANGCSPQHMHAALLERHFQDLDFTRIFTIVRHPVQRFLSEYRFRRQSGHALAMGSADEFYEAAFARRSVQPGFLDNHLRPQVEFPWRDCRVYRLEQGMSVILEDLARGLALDPTAHVERAMRSDPRLPTGLASSTEGSLRAFYADDFRAFGYE